jgi:hypothetical protein
MQYYTYDEANKKKVKRQNDCWGGAIDRNAKLAARRDVSSTDRSSPNLLWLAVCKLQVHAARGGCTKTGTAHQLPNPTIQITWPTCRCLIAASSDRTSASDNIWLSAENLLVAQYVPKCGIRRLFMDTIWSKDPVSWLVLENRMQKIHDPRPRVNGFQFQWAAGPSPFFLFVDQTMYPSVLLIFLKYSWSTTRRLLRNDLAKHSSWIS